MQRLSRIQWVRRIHRNVPGHNRSMSCFHSSHLSISRNLTSSHLSVPSNLSLIYRSLTTTPSTIRQANPNQSRNETKESGSSFYCVICLLSNSVDTVDHVKDLEKSSDRDLDALFKHMPDFRLKYVNTGPGQLVY